MSKKTSKIGELSNIFKKNNIIAKTIEQNDEIIHETNKEAEKTQDYRQAHIYVICLMT